MMKKSAMKNRQNEDKNICLSGDGFVCNKYWECVSEKPQHLSDFGRWHDYEYMNAFLSRYKEEGSGDDLVPEIVLPENCGTNEEFNPCGSRCGERGTLGDYSMWCNDFPDECFPRCECLKGFIRNSKWECVRPQSRSDFAGWYTHKYRETFFKPADDLVPEIVLPENCGTNEEFDPCGSRCRGERGTLREYSMWCNDFPDECFPRCECLKGFIRNSRWECIRPQH